MPRPTGFYHADSPDTGRLQAGAPTREEFVCSVEEGVGTRPQDFQWLDANIPCQAACPAGTDIPAYLDAIAHDDPERAYRINLRDNVFPAVLGRVCTRPCEPACRHGWEGLGESVAICFAKRSADEFMKRSEPVVLPPIFPPSGKRVAVIGGGAAGLAAARELVRLGHAVTVYERYREAGGLMIQGIPAFRLPPEIVRREVAQVEAAGVEICCGVEIGRDKTLEEVRDGADAVILATGALKPYVPDLPGVDLDGVRHGLPFLQNVNAGHAETVGHRVLVIGGGFTAVDCARTARRLGAESVRMAYRRTETEMYITGHELTDMRDEGIAFDTLVAPVAFEGEGGALRRAVLQRTEMVEADESGRARPRPVDGSEFTVDVDTVLLGTGQVRDPGAWPAALAEAIFGRDGAPKRGTAPETPVDGLYITGDLTSGSASLIDAIGHARTCAMAVDRGLMGKDRLREVAVIEDAADTGRTREMDEIPRQSMPTLPDTKRGLDDEVETGYDWPAARTEARRCYLCHYKYEIDNDLCIYCDRCLKVKPVEGCIVKISELHKDEEGRITGWTPSTSNRDYNLLFIDQNQCIRCGACAEVCPVDCIPLQKVSRRTIAADALPEDE